MLDTVTVVFLFVFFKSILVGNFFKIEPHKEYFSKNISSLPDFWIQTTSNFL